MQQAPLQKAHKAGNLAVVVQKLLAVATLFTLLLSGCSKKGGDAHEDTFTCPDGQVINLADVAGHHDAGFDANASCPEPPSVRLLGIPASLGAYKSTSFSWELDNGSLVGAHSMLTSIRYRTSAANASSLAGPETFGQELLKKEHNNLPVTFLGNLTFTVPGTFYLRAYAEVNYKDYWSAETRLNVTPVTASGAVHQFVHSPGDFLGETTPAEKDILLGDTVTFKNDDVKDHVFTFLSGPATVPAVTVPAQMTSAEILLTVPGVYELETDDVQKQALKITVKLSA